MDIAKVTEQYYENNAEKLHKMVDKIIKGFGGLSQKDADDFYSLANEVFWIAVNDFNGHGDFNGFLYSRLTRKIMSMITKRNRKKRADIEIIEQTDGSIKRIYHHPASLDAPIKNDNGATTTYRELIESKFDIWDEISDEIDAFYADKVKRYLERLPKIQRSIVTFLVEGYKPSEIREELHITESEYSDHMIGIRASENISILF